jgi:hypothetical protein
MASLFELLLNCREGIGEGGARPHTQRSTAPVLHAAKRRRSGHGQVRIALDLTAQQTARGTGRAAGRVSSAARSTLLIKAHSE